MNQQQFNQTVLQVRRAVLHAGAQPGLRWWSGDVLKAEVLKTLFPALGADAGVTLLEQTVRRIGSEERAEGYTLFDFTEEHEVVLRQEGGPPGSHDALPAFSSGSELARWLGQTYALPPAPGGKWALSLTNRHATQPDPWTTDRTSEANLGRLGLLVRGLAQSEAEVFLQPVLIAATGPGA